MVTVAVNPLNIIQNQSPGTVPGSGQIPDANTSSQSTDFGQILSGQIGDRQQASSTQAVPASTGNNAPAKSAPIQNTPAVQTTPAASAASGIAALAATPAVADNATPAATATPVAATVPINTAMVSTSNTNQAATALAGNATLAAEKNARSQHTAANLSNQQQTPEASNTTSSPQSTDQSGNSQSTTVSGAAPSTDATPVSHAAAVAALMDSVAGMVNIIQASASAPNGAAQDKNPSTSAQKAGDSAQGNTVDASAINAQAIASSTALPPDAIAMAAALQSTVQTPTPQTAGAGTIQTAPEKSALSSSAKIPSASPALNHTTAAPASLAAGQATPSPADLSSTATVASPAPAQTAAQSQSTLAANNAAAQTAAVSKQSMSTADLSAPLASSASGSPQNTASSVPSFATAIANTVGGSAAAMHQTGPNASAEGIAALGAIVPQNQGHASAVTLGSAGSSSLQPPVGSPDWNTALGQQVSWMANNHQQTATLSLNPPDLGPVHIVLNLSDNQQLGASFLAAQPETRAALEAAMPRLREMLDSAGIQLGQTSVGSGNTPSDNGNDRTPQNSRSFFSGNIDESATGSETLTAPQINSQRAGTGLIDTHV
jgi:flagellar hook-length control protein FliK